MYAAGVLGSTLRGMNLDHYLERIHYTGTPGVNWETLSELHHQHLLHIPYENIDVKLGRKLDFDRERIFDKLVTRKRGGWCYEMNGLLQWALQEIGFPVRRMSGAVMRETRGDIAAGNHLVLEVMLDGQPYLADVGLGDGARYPVPIARGEHNQGGLDFKLRAQADGYWRFVNHGFSNVRSFDFRHCTADERALADMCTWLQTSPDSPFTTLLIVQRFTADSIEVLLGKVATTITATGKTVREIENADALQADLAARFDLHEDVRPLWDDIEAKHQQFFSEPSAS